MSGISGQPANGLPSRDISPGDNATSDTQGYNKRRRQLIISIRSAEKICTKKGDAKVKELSNDDTEANLFTLYKKLSQTKEDRTGYPINYLSIFSHMRTISSLL